jgi:hypothetical protein
MKRFDITFKNEKENTYRFIILLFVILHVLLFSYLLFDAQLWKKGVGGLVITLLYGGYRLLITNTSKQKFSFGSGYFFVLSFIAINDSWWLWGLELLLYTLSATALSPLILSFTSMEIKKVPFPFKKYKWNEFSNVMLKDNILTLDFKNNKLLQAEIATPNINEEAFNTFAKEQLIKSD